MLQAPMLREAAWTPSGRVRCDRIGSAQVYHNGVANVAHVPSLTWCALDFFVVAPFCIIACGCVFRHCFDIRRLPPRPELSDAIVLYV